MALSIAARRAQSHLANATKSGHPRQEIDRLRTSFAVARAQDAVRAIPGSLAHAEREALLAAVVRLPVVDGGEAA